jgi:hypothetical protein
MPLYLVANLERIAHFRPLECAAGQQKSRPQTAISRWAVKFCPLDLHDRV